MTFNSTWWLWKAWVSPLHRLVFPGTSTLQTGLAVHLAIRERMVMVIEKVKMVHPGLSYGWHSSSSSSASQSPPAAHSREAFLPASTFSLPPAGWMLWGGGGWGGGSWWQRWWWWWYYISLIDGDEGGSDVIIFSPELVVGESPADVVSRSGCPSQFQPEMEIMMKVWKYKI